MTMATIAPDWCGKGYGVDPCLIATQLFDVRDKLMSHTNEFTPWNATTAIIKTASIIYIYESQF